MIAEILCVGTELLLGNTVNTNATFLANRCADYGLSIYHQQVVGDNEERLSDAFKEALSRADVIFTSGGLGPTNDDITKEVISETLGLELKENAEAKEAMYAFFEKLGRKNVSSINDKQYMIPEGAVPLINRFGTAPAVLIETDKTPAKDKYPNKIIILLPGPPRELIPITEEYLDPYFAGKMNGVIHSRTVKLCGIGESDAASKIYDILSESLNPTVSPYAKTNEVHLRITAKADSVEQAESLIQPVYEEISAKLGKYIYTYKDDENLEDVVVSMAVSKNIRLAVAESCTGGLISSRLVNVSGASDCFVEGYVTYSNDAKINTLGVSADIIEKYGAVSAECAGEMARCAALKAGADMAVSTTGIAGPLGGSDEKPVGLVYIGCYNNGSISVKKYTFPGSRQMIRDASTTRALDILRAELLDI